MSDDDNNINRFIAIISSVTAADIAEGRPAGSRQSFENNRSSIASAHRVRNFAHYIKFPYVVDEFYKYPHAPTARVCARIYCPPLACTVCCEADQTKEVRCNDTATLCGCAMYSLTCSRRRTLHAVSLIAFEHLVNIRSRAEPSVVHACQLEQTAKH
jgi:hypothetical protein